MPPTLPCPSVAPNTANTLFKEVTSFAAVFAGAAVAVPVVFTVGTAGAVAVAAAFAATVAAAAFAAATFAAATFAAAALAAATLAAATAANEFVNPEPPFPVPVGADEPLVDKVATINTWVSVN